MMERIKEFKEEHLDECAHLIVSAFNIEPWNENWTFDTAKKTLYQTLEAPGFMGFVSAEDEIMGFATGCCEQDDKKEVFYLDTLCVKPDVQGKGVGSRLLEHLKGHLEKSGINLSIS